ncbi:unnamed protein product [marine sediment metagenome]|uniref:Uncharacterized protein n=1 Tax=marine sediment metagenome TaxID=412755 RepID=X1E2P9_9ZZZZ
MSFAWNVFQTLDVYVGYQYSKLSKNATLCTIKEKMGSDK